MNRRTFTKFLPCMPFVGKALCEAAPEYPIYYDIDVPGVCIPVSPLQYVQLLRNGQIEVWELAERFNIPMESPVDSHYLRGVNARLLKGRVLIPAK